MNFLAHSYLSGEFDELMVGNMMADFIKGKPDINLSTQIKNGIDLHRKIDSFTDSHPIVRISKSRLFPTYHHYSSVIIDIFYDHFLAVDWESFSTVLLNDFSQGVYEVLKKNELHLPHTMKRMLFYMQSQNWLVSYASVDEIGKVLERMAARTKFPSGMEYAVRDLKKDYKLYREEFNLYFPQLMQYVNVVKATYLSQESNLSL